MLSRKVLEEVRKNPNSTGTQIANDIIAFYKNLHGKKLDFKNVQRRVYDALNVFAALGIINKERNNIEYNGTKRAKKHSEPPPSQAPQKAQLLKELCVQFLSIRKLMERNYHHDHEHAEEDKMPIPLLMLQLPHSSALAVDIND